MTDDGLWEMEKGDLIREVRTLTSAAERWEQWQRDLSTKADGKVHCDYRRTPSGNPTCTEALWNMRLQIGQLENFLRFKRGRPRGCGPTLEEIAAFFAEREARNG